MKRFNLIRGHSPLLISIPHMGTYVPEAMRKGMTEAALKLPDTDWHVDRLYYFAKELGANILMATHSRYVIDLNRPQDDAHLYPGQLKTGLCPVETFTGEEIYRDKEDVPDEIEKLNRVASYWLPYHETLAAELARIKEKHGYALLYDSHSIKSEVPRLFEGRLWDLNLGSSKGTACDPEMAQAALEAASSGSYSAVLDKRFVGGYITRNYGDPANDIHAIQMEQVWGNYMDEEHPYPFREDKAQKLQEVLRPVLKAIIGWGRKRYA